MTVYEDALEIAGIGPFHWSLVLLCGWANAADAVEVLSISFILPNVEEQFGLTGLEKGWLAAVIFIGMLLGGWIWGTLADQIGRRRCLISALLVNAAAAAVSSLSPTFALLALLRFVAGLGVGGSIPVVFSYFSEFAPATHRPQLMVAMSMSWMVGSVLTASLAWIIIPSHTPVHLFGTEWHSWRTFALACCIPALSCAVLFTFAPESPRWLLQRHQMSADAALQADSRSTLYQMFITNRSARPSTFTDFASFRHNFLSIFELCRSNQRARLSLEIDNSADPDDFDSQLLLPESSNPTSSSVELIHPSISASEFAQRLSTLVLVYDNSCSESDQLSHSVPPSNFCLAMSWRAKSFLHTSARAFQPQYRTSTLMMMTIWFCLAFGSYGISLWVPSFFSHYQTLNIYQSTFIGSAAALPGNVINWLTVQRFGAKRTQCSLTTSSFFFLQDLCSFWAV